MHARVSYATISATWRVDAITAAQIGANWRVNSHGAATVGGKGGNGAVEVAVV